MKLAIILVCIVVTYAASLDQDEMDVRELLEAYSELYDGDKREQQPEHRDIEESKHQRGHLEDFDLDNRGYSKYSKDKKDEDQADASSDENVRLLARLLVDILQKERDTQDTPMETYKRRRPP